MCSVGTWGRLWGTGLGAQGCLGQTCLCPPAATSQPSRGFQFVLPRGHVLAGPFFLKLNLKVGGKLAEGHKPGMASPAPRARGLPATRSPVGLPCSSATWKEMEAPLLRAAPADHPPRGTGHLQGHKPLSRTPGGDLGLRAMCVTWSAEKGAGLWWKTRSCLHCRLPWAPSWGVAATAPGPSACQARAVSVTPALPRDQSSVGGGKGL